ncbi:MAG: hypothetical protein R3C68_14180 [Myxococcota bacterium]
MGLRFIVSPECAPEHLRGVCGTIDLDGTMLRLGRIFYGFFFDISSPRRGGAVLCFLGGRFGLRFAPRDVANRALRSRCTN